MRPQMPFTSSAHAFASLESTSGSHLPPLGKLPLHPYPTGNPCVSPADFPCGGSTSDPTPSHPRQVSNPTPSAPPKGATSAKRSSPVFVASATSTVIFASWDLPTLRSSGRTHPRKGFGAKEGHRSRALTLRARSSEPSPAGHPWTAKLSP
jgi:hypothetical protein